jgi:hypothetical protein
LYFGKYRQVVEFAGKLPFGMLTSKLNALNLFPFILVVNVFSLW